MSAQCPIEWAAENGARRCLKIWECPEGGVVDEFVGYATPESLRGIGYVSEEENKRLRVALAELADANWPDKFVYGCNSALYERWYDAWQAAWEALEGRL